MYISLEYENENYRLLEFSDEEFILLDLKNETFKKLEMCWYTTLVDILDFVVINCDKDFIVGYLNKLLKIVDEDEEKEMIKDILDKYEN
jgi:hypothetical protein